MKVKNPLKGIRVKTGDKTIKVSLDDIRKAPRTNILSPTVFQAKMRMNMQKEKKPIKFIGGK